MLAGFLGLLLLATPVEHVYVVSSLTKVRPNPKRPSELRESLGWTALRGECEASQVVVDAGDATLQISATASPISSRIRLRIYREELIDLAEPSGLDGHPGRWPDPLIPVVDRYAGEARKAFPFTVPAGETAALFVEVCVDENAEPGTYQHALTLLINDSKRTIPIRLRVLEARIPSTATFPTTFGFSASRAGLGHLGRKPNDEERLEFSRLYRSALLAHRISAHGGTFEPPPFTRRGGDLELRFDEYDRELSPFLEGPGARATTVELRSHPGLHSDEERSRYARAIARHHRDKGWQAILFSYERDEPRLDELAGVAAHARILRETGVSVLVTSSHHPILEGLVDIFAPNLNCLFVKKRPEETCQWRASRTAYGPTRKRGGQLWWYLSCTSHGCAAPSSYARGWPTYVIDVPGARARAMGWLAFQEQIEGELYWDVLHAYGRSDPWTDPRALAGNGDGTLFYPGTPTRIGGKSHIPIESLGLKHIRDGLEDLELLRLVAKKPGGEAFARAILSRLLPAPYRITEGPEAWESARKKLLSFLSGDSKSVGSP